MQWLKRAVLIIVLLLVALATIDFKLENQQHVALQFLEISSPELPVSLFVVTAFLLGSMLDIYIGGFLPPRLRLLAMLQRIRLDRQGREIDNLRPQVDKACTPSRR